MSRAHVPCWAHGVWVGAWSTGCMAQGRLLAAMRRMGVRVECADEESSQKHEVLWYEQELQCRSCAHVPTRGDAVRQQEGEDAVPTAVPNEAHRVVKCRLGLPFACTHNKEQHNSAPSDNL